MYQRIKILVLLAAASSSVSLLSSCSWKDFFCCCDAQQSRPATSRVRNAYADAELLRPLVLLVHRVQQNSQSEQNVDNNWRITLPPLLRLRVENTN